MNKTEIQAFMKICRDLMLVDQQSNIINSVNQYFDINSPEFSNLIKRLKLLPNANRSRLSDALSDGQIQSKLWLIEELDNLNILDKSTIFVVGGWFGLLPLLMFWMLDDIKKIRSFDIDEDCEKIADSLNREYVLDGWSFKATTVDMFDLNYDDTTYITKRFDNTTCSLTDTPDIIINTSCEHIDNFDEWLVKIPHDRILILQTNDYFELDEHVNCSKSLNDFTKKIDFHKILYSGTLKLEKYQRYMIIGQR